MLLLAAATGGTHPRDIPFHRLTAPERSALHDSARRSHPAAPSVEIDRHGKQIVVFATLGEKPTGGYEIEITRITATRTTLVVMSRVTAPGRGAVLAQVLTYPSDAVSIAASAMPRSRRLLYVELVDQEGRRLSKVTMKTAETRREASASSASPR